jgi:3-dehydroquinate dehydratase I
MTETHCVINAITNVRSRIERSAMSALRIGKCELGTVPRSLAIVDEFFTMHDIKRLKKIGTDLLEIRVDGFDKDIDAVCDYIVKIRKAVSLPLIGTIRENKRTKVDRIGYFAKIIPLVDAIDIEIDAPIGKQVIKMAKGKTVIVSEHAFSGTPSDANLRRIVKKASGLGCNIVKIAAMANCREDVARLLSFTRECKKPIVAFSMGEHGSISRVLSPLFGSLYTYGFVKKANAPGQLPIGKLIEQMRCFYPELQ